MTRRRGLCRGQASVSSRALASPQSSAVCNIYYLCWDNAQKWMFFLNERKVAARISRIKAWLAGNQGRVLKTGRAAEPSTVGPVPGEQGFGSPEERLLLWHWDGLPFPFATACSGGKPNPVSSMDCLGKPSPAELVLAAHDDNQPYVFCSHPYY